MKGLRAYGNTITDGTGFRTRGIVFVMQGLHRWATRTIQYIFFLVVWFVFVSCTKCHTLFLVPRCKIFGCVRSGMTRRKCQSWFTYSCKVLYLLFLSLYLSIYLCLFIFLYLYRSLSYISFAIQFY